MVSPVKHFVAVSLVALLAACSTPAPPTGRPAVAAPVTPPNTVIIDNFTFSPPMLTVQPGTTITWINRDDVPHTVTSTTEPRLLNSPALDTDAKFSFTFTSPGTYPYYCTVHPHMTATIVCK